VTASSQLASEIRGLTRSDFDKDMARRTGLPIGSVRSVWTRLVSLTPVNLLFDICGRLAGNLVPDR